MPEGWMPEKMRAMLGWLRRGLAGGQLPQVQNPRLRESDEAIHRHRLIITEPCSNYRNFKCVRPSRYPIEGAVMSRTFGDFLHVRQNFDNLPNPVGAGFDGFQGPAWHRSDGSEAGQAYKLPSLRPDPYLERRRGVLGGGGTRNLLF